MGPAVVGLVVPEAAVGPPVADPAAVAALAVGPAPVGKPVAGPVAAGLAATQPAVRPPAVGPPVAGPAAAASLAHPGTSFFDHLGKASVPARNCFLHSLRNSVLTRLHYRPLPAVPGPAAGVRAASL